MSETTKQQSREDFVEVPQSRLAEYDEACLQLLWEVLHSLMAAQDPLLSQIYREPVDEVPAEGAPSGVMLGASSPPIPMSTSFVERVDGIVNTDTGAWASMLHEAAEQSVQQLMPQFFEQVGNILRSAGQEVDARGQPMTIDLFLDGLEKVDIDFDGEGKAKLPTLVLSPELAERFKALEWTEAHKARFDRMVEDKRKAFNARRRVRRLD